MANAANERFERSGGSSGSRPQPHADPAPPAAGGSDETGCVWYVAQGGTGQQEGPFTLTALKHKAASGALSPNDLVWKPDLPAWTPAQSIPGLFDVQGASPVMLTAVSGASPAALAPVRRLVNAITHPMFFFVAGLVFAVLAVLAFVGSLVGLYWKHSWFDGAVWFLLLFLVSEAACGILELLRRIEQGPQRQQGKANG